MEKTKKIKKKPINKIWKYQDTGKENKFGRRY
jgi:hypothetical protein